MKRSVPALIVTAGIVAAVLTYRVPGPTVPDSRAIGSVAKSDSGRTTRSELHGSRPRTTLAPTSTLPGTTPTSIAPSTTVLPTTTAAPSTTQSPTTAMPTTTPSIATTVAPITITGNPIATNVPGNTTTYGLVQVQITEEGGHIAANATELPPDGDTNGAGTEEATSSISAFAAPVLERETVAAQDANISTVSGATYTSEAFISSLQSAISEMG